MLGLPAACLLLRSSPLAAGTRCLIMALVGADQISQPWQVNEFLVGRFPDKDRIPAAPGFDCHRLLQLINFPVFLFECQPEPLAA